MNWRSAVVQVVQDPESNRGLAAAVRAAAVRAGRAGNCDVLQTFGFVVDFFFTMVLILVVNSEIGMHVKSNICY